MTWIMIIVLGTIIVWKVVSAIDKYSRNHFIPEEELWEKYLRTDEYVPWSYQKRMRYYNRQARMQSKFMESKRPYVSYIETGYIHRRT